MPREGSCLCRSALGCSEPHRPPAVRMGREAGGHRGPGRGEKVIQGPEGNRSTIVMMFDSAFPCRRTQGRKGTDRASYLVPKQQPAAPG